MTCWDVLGIAQTKDRGDIRRAYASRLKATNPEDDAEGFKALRAAYEQALGFADQGTPPPTVMPKLHPQTIEVTLRVNARPGVKLDELEDAQTVERKAFTAALNQFQDCLRPEADAETRVPAFNALIHSPAMATIDLRNDTEERIAWSLSRNIPRSDAVINLAITYFGWDSHDTGLRLPRAAGHVLQRQKDIDRLRTLASGDDSHRKAFNVLSAPPQPITIRSRLLSPARPEAIAAFLSDVLRPQPSLRNDLNADTLAAWQTFLTRPHLSTLGLWSLALSLPALVIGALFFTVVPSDYRSLGILTILPPAFGAAALIYTLGIELPRRRWRAYRGLAPAWQRWGWFVSTAALLIATAVPLDSWLLTGLVAILACTTIAWILITGEPDLRPTRFPWLVNAALSEVNFSIWTVVTARSLPLPSAARLVVMLVAVVAVSAYGRIPLHKAWESAPTDVRRAAALAVAALATFAIVALWPLATDPSLYPAVIAIVAAFVLLHRGIYAPSTAEARRARFFSVVPACLFIATAGTDGGIVVGSSLILAWIAYVTLRTGLVQRSLAK